MGSRSQVQIISSLLLSIGILLSSCDTDRHSETYLNVSNDGWNQDSSLCITSSEIKDISDPYHIILMARHTTEFKYKNMFFFIDIETPSGKIISDTAEVLLQDNQGYWYGDGSGFLREVQEHEMEGNYKRNTLLPEVGIYKFCVRHGMRDEVLYDMSDIGIRIEYAK